MAALDIAYVAVLAAALSGVLPLLVARRRYAQRVAFALLAASAIAAIVAGAWALTGETTLAERLPLGLPWLKWHVRLDVLSGFFHIVIGVVVLATSFYGPSYLREYESGQNDPTVLNLASGFFIAGMLLVLLADDAFSFMVAWEVMSVASYLLVTFHHEHAANRRAGFLYLLMAQIGAVGILLGFGVLATFGGHFTFDAMRGGNVPAAWASVAFALAFFGFGMKAGMIPVHAWLPEAHPVTPSHISALMSGVMLKVAIYGFVRFTFDLLVDVQWQWGVAVLLIGAGSALFGVLYAYVQQDLKRLLAYSSIENIGIILMALGLSLIFVGSGHPVLGAIGLVAALYHVLNHAVFKGLLFLGSGAVLYRTHERDLEHLGGLIHRMPVTAAVFLVGCVAISALPPLNGFVSEWLIFQTALQAPALENGVLRTLLPIAAAVLALTGALAAATFVKVYGIAFLGKARTRHAAHAREVPRGMRVGMVLLAALCLLLGVLPTTVIGVIDAIPQLLIRQRLPSATAHGWLWLTPVSPDIASYSAPLVLLAIALSFFIGRRLLPARQVRRTPPWDCGFGPLTNRMQYTSTAFAMPIRRIFAPVWHVQEQVEVTRRHEADAPPTGLRHQLHIEDRTWLALYEPIGHYVIGAARAIGLIQTGSVRTYLLYSFLTLLFLLWIVT